MRERLREIQDRVDRACESVGRKPNEVIVIAVSKTVELELLMEAYELGVRDFGESRLQEALPKIEQMPSDVVWHFIGKMQSNKARRIAQSFSVVHTVESESQIRELDKANREIQGLIEVNVARESQKAGVFAETLDESVQLLLSSAYVRYRGLMTIGPLASDPEQSRSVFREIAKLGKRYGAQWLSMGMSTDYDVAIQEGATHVRIGSALFGERK